MSARARCIVPAVVAALLLVACPGLSELDVKIEAPREPGRPYVLTAKVTLRSLLRLAAGEAPPRGFSGRAQFGVRAPAGWSATGGYRIGDRDFSLMPAPMVAKGYEEAAPSGSSGGAIWHGFVSHLHTELSADATIDVRVALSPPRAAAEPTSASEPRSTGSPNGASSTSGAGSTSAADSTTAPSAGGLEVALGIGPAPHYPQWKSALVPRVVRLP